MRDCIVVGGGIAGLCAARALARRGLRVLLLADARRRAAASQVAGGILSSMRPWAESPESFRLSSLAAAAYPQFASSLREETGIDPEYVRSGLVMLNAQDAAVARQWCAARNMDCQSWSRTHVPQGMHPPPHALLLPHIAHIRTPRLLRALSASLDSLGVETRQDCRAERLWLVGQRCQGVHTTAGNLRADRVVVAAGAWVQSLLERAVPDLVLRSDIDPVRGQMLCLKFSVRPFAPILLDGARYLIPRQDGHVLLGSTMERTGLDCATTGKAKAELLDWARRTWPGVLDGALLWHRAGLRPASRRGYPWSGAASGLDNVYLHTGHFRKGILQAPFTAERLAEQIVQETSPGNPDDC